MRSSSNDKGLQSYPLACASAMPPGGRTGLQLTLHSLDMSKRESRVS